MKQQYEVINLDFVLKKKKKACHMLDIKCNFKVQS